MGRVRAARRDARRVRPGGRRTGRLFAYALSSRRERAGRDQPGRSGAVGLTVLARPVPRPDRRPQASRSSGSANVKASPSVGPRLPRRRLPAQHRTHRAARRTSGLDAADRQPRTGHVPRTRTTRHRPGEVLADLPKIPDQPQPHDVSHQGHPHPGKTTLKTLMRRVEERALRMMRQVLSRAKERSPGLGVERGRG